MATASRPGPWPGWNGVGFGLAALAVAALVILYAPPAPVPDRTSPTTQPRTGTTISLEEFQAMLTDAADDPPAVTVETPDGPVTVIIPETPATTSPPTSAATTTTTTTTTTSVPPRRSLPTVDGILDDLLGGESTPTTIPEGAGGEG